MASCWWRCLLVVFVFVQDQVICGVFDRILDDVQPCKETCDKTYPLKTYPNDKYSECCKRGCRFFSLVEFVNDRSPINATLTKEACTASCMEAYSQTGDRYACNIGCSSQLPFALERQKETKDDPPSMHLLTPFMFVHNIYNNMVDRMSRVMSVSWSFYLQQDDGKVVVLQSEPEIITEYLDMEEVDYDKIQDDLNDSTGYARKDGDVDDKMQLEKSSSELRFRVLPDMYNYRQSQEAAVDGSRETNPSRSSYFGSNDSVSVVRADWLGCFARKSGLPRWLIGLIILVSALAMIWLSLTTPSAAPDQHIRTQKLSIYGDLDYLCLHESQEKIRIQPPCEHEAPPMPLKIHLQQL